MSNPAWAGGALASPVVDVGPVSAYLNRLADSGRRTQAGALERAARVLTDGARGAYGVAWHRITHAELLRLRERLRARYQPATVNNTLAAVRGVLRAAFRMGLTDGDTMARVTDVPGVPVSDLPTGRALPRAELAAVMGAASAPSRDGTELRDAALVGVLIATGARIGEATRMDAGDVAGDLLTIRHGKGGHAREVPLPPKTAARVAAWLEQRAPILAAAQTHTRLWVAIGKRGPTGKPLSLRSCYARVVVAASRAGLPDVTPHDLRRTYATTLLSGGADPLLVAGLLGHRDVRTTMRYDRRALDVARGYLGVLDV